MKQAVAIGALLMIALGAAALVYGVASWSSPAAWIVGGLLTSAAGLGLGRLMQ